MFFVPARGVGDVAPYKCTPECMLKFAGGSFGKAEIMNQPLRRVGTGMQTFSKNPQNSCNQSVFCQDNRTDVCYNGITNRKTP